MKNLPRSLVFFSLVAVFLLTAGCVQDSPRRNPYHRSVGRSPYIGSPEWITWVDHKVDTRYANGLFPEPGSQEWYAIVDHVVFTDSSRDYYRDNYRRQYNDDYRRTYRSDDYRRSYRAPAGYGGRHNYASGSNYYGPARIGSQNGPYRSDYGRYALGSVEWKRAVDAEILSGRVPPPPARLDPWDIPLGTTSDR